MLKGKKGIYILLPLVLFIWVTILYKVVDAFGDKETPELSVASVTPVSFKNISRDTFSISTISRDPFLNTLSTKKVVSSKKGLKKPFKNKKRTTWPRIAYKGKVSDKKGKSAVYVIEISNEMHFMKLNDVASGVKLLKAQDQKVTLNFEGNTKEIEISK